MSDETTAAGVPAGEDAANEAAAAELRQLASLLDPVPAEAIAAARSAIAWRTMDVELAELTADTSFDADSAGVRSDAAPTMLTFDAPGLTVEVEVLEDARSRRFLGQLVPPGAGEVEIRHGGGRVVGAADELGRFSASGIAPGPVSLRCQVGALVVETDWFLA